VIFDPRQRTSALGLSFLAFALTAFATLGTRNRPVATASDIELAAHAYPRLPLSFEPTDERDAPSCGAYVSRGAGYGLRVDRRGASIRVVRGSDAVAAGHRDNTIRMEFVGASRNARVSGGSALAGKANYLLGNDPAKWRTDVPMYRDVRCSGIYPGVDVVYYGSQERLEYDVVVAPGTDPARVRWQLTGADSVALNADGDLVLHTAGGVLRQQRPIVYQEREGRRDPVEGGYVLSASASGPQVVALDIGDYDRSRPLVIDPVLSYSTYLGGAGSDNGLALAVDASGCAYVTGATASADFPTQGALQPTQGGTAARGDLFITKLDPNGTTLLYSTYLGGGGGDEARGIAVDASGSAYLTGVTDSANFPVANALYGTPRGDLDAFVTKLSPTGNALEYSTYLGGNGPEVGVGIAVATSGEASVFGRTGSTNFPLANAFQPAPGSTQLFREAFVSRLSASGGSLVYSTYLGGDRDEMLGDFGGVAVDADGNTYVAGGTTSQNFPVTAGALDGTLDGTPGSTEGFVVKYDTQGVPVFATYLGGGGNELINAIAVTGSGEACVTGSTASSDFPAVNAIRETYSGGDDAFVAKLGSSGAALVYSTYLGGTGQDLGRAIAVDSAGGVCVVGATFSTNFPIARPLQPPAGSFDAFVTRLNSLGSTLSFSTYLGGFSQDFATGVGIDPSGDVFVTGFTLSAAFPLAFPLQPALHGTVDAFVARISEGAAPPVFPTGLTADSVCNMSAALRWTDNSDDEDAFEIERRTGAGPFVPIAAMASDTTSFEDSGLTPNTAYVYRVRATNQDGASGYSNELTVTTLLATVTPPSDLAVTVLGHNSLRLTWQDNSSDEAGFRIERATNPGGSFALLQTVAANLEEFTDTGLTAETSYSYRVRAASGGCDSASTPIATGLTLPQPVNAPSLLVGLAVSESQISLTWKDNSPNETGFRIERKVGDVFEPRGLVGPDEVTFVDTGLTPTTGYTYRVRALSGTGVSEPSNEVRVTTSALPRGILKVKKTVNFGTVRVGVTKTRSLVIRNGSRVEQMRLTIGSVVPPFTATGAGVHTVLIGGNRNLVVTFKPTAPGKVSAKLLIQSTDPRKPSAEVTFTGKGK